MRSIHCLQMRPRTVPLRSRSVSYLSDHNAGRIEECRSIRGAQSISNPGLGQDVLRPLGIVFDLLTQLSHVDPEILGIGCSIPQLAQQEFVREYFTGVLDEQAQEFVLL